MEKNYLVVINYEQQYSIWPAAKPLPAGWSAVGDAKAYDECVQQIEQQWSDIRPRSLREANNAAG